MDTTLEERIRMVRKENRLTQAEFAERCGTSKSCIVKWERSETIPGAPMIRLIATEFCVSEEWLATGSGVMHDAESELRENDRIARKLTESMEHSNVMRSMVNAYLSLDDRQRAAVDAFIEKLSAEVIGSNDPVTAADLHPVDLDRASE